YYKQGIEDMISDRWSKETHRCIFEALNGIRHWEDSRIDFFKAEMSTRTEETRSDDQEYEFSYADLPRLSLNDVEDMYLLQNRVEDIQLGVESYQQTLNLTKPMMFFEGIDQRIPFTMTAMHKGVVYLNQHNVKSLMKLSEVKKFCDGTLEKIYENQIEFMKRNKLGTAPRVEWRFDTVINAPVPVLIHDCKDKAIWFNKKLEIWNKLKVMSRPDDLSDTWAEVVLVKKAASIWNLPLKSFSRYGDRSVLDGVRYCLELK
ncbi:hypothetical protein Tco_1347815, partial [Tanacetum coccineum]